MPLSSPDGPTVDIVDFLDEFPEYAPKPVERSPAPMRQEDMREPALLVSFKVDHEGRDMTAKKVAKRIRHAREALLGVLAEEVKFMPDGEVHDAQVPLVLFRRRVDDIKRVLSGFPTVDALTVVEGAGIMPLQAKEPAGKKKKTPKGHAFGIPATSIAAMRANNFLDEDELPLSHEDDED
jgi:hypothetical protein